MFSFSKSALTFYKLHILYLLTKVGNTSFSYCSWLCCISLNGIQTNEKYVVNALTLWTWLNLHEMLFEHMNANAVNMEFLLCVYVQMNINSSILWQKKIFQNVAYWRKQVWKYIKREYSTWKIIYLIFALCFCGFIHIFEWKMLTIDTNCEVFYISLMHSISCISFHMSIQWNLRIFFVRCLLYFLYIYWDMSAYTFMTSVAA